MIVKSVFLIPEAGELHKEEYVPCQLVWRAESLNREGLYLSSYWHGTFLGVALFGLLFCAVKPLKGED